MAAILSPARRQLLSPQVDTTCRLVTENGVPFLVDNADFDRISEFRWRAAKCGGATYIRAWAKGRHLYLHRLVLGLDCGELGDHINGDPTDNRRANLRRATHSQNAINRHRGVRRRFRGVWKCNGRWAAKVRAYGRQYHLGVFDTPRAAAVAYNRVIRRLHGEFAVLNEV